MATQTVQMMEMSLEELMGKGSEQPTEILKAKSLAHSSADWMAMQTVQMMEMSLEELMEKSSEELMEILKDL
jgi:FtsZ-binding cell division protein ZapB